MPLDSFPSSSATAVPPAPSTARLLLPGSPSSTAKMQAMVAEELALRSMDVEEPSTARRAPDLASLWRGKRRRSAVRRLEDVRLVKAGSSQDGDVDGAPSSRAPVGALRVGLVVAAVGVVVIAVVALLAAAA